MVTRKTLWIKLPLWGTLLAVTVGAATVKFEVTNLGTLGGQTVSGISPQLQRYTYYLSEISLLRGQELDIRFNPALFSSLTAGASDPGFNVMVFQPNQPVGAFGDFSALALWDQSSSVASFSVDFLYYGGGSAGPQPYFINQFNANGGFTTLQSGLTSLPQSAQVPEPRTFLLCAAALLACGIWRAPRR